MSMNPTYLCRFKCIALSLHICHINLVFYRHFDFNAAQHKFNNMQQCEKHKRANGGGGKPDDQSVGRPSVYEKSWPCHLLHPVSTKLLTTCSSYRETPCRWIEKICAHCVKTSRNQVAGCAAKALILFYEQIFSFATCLMIYFFIAKGNCKYQN